MAAKLIVAQAVDFNGAVMSGAKLNVYEAGTTTRRAIYTESSLATQTANPVVAGSDGGIAVWVDDSAGPVKIALTNAAESAVYYSEDSIDLSATGNLLVYPLNGNLASTDTQLAAIEAAGDSEIAALATARATEVSAIETAGDAELAEIGTAGDAELTEIAAAGDAEEASIASAGTAQITAIENAGAAEEANVAAAAAAEFYADVAAGESGTVDGDYFYVVEQNADGENVFNLYKNVSGTGTFVAAFVSKETMDRYIAIIDTNVVGDAPIIEFSGDRWVFIERDTDGYFVQGLTVDGRLAVGDPDEFVSTTSDLRSVEETPIIEYGGGRFVRLIVDEDDLPIEGLTAEGFRYHRDEDGRFVLIGAEETELVPVIEFSGQRWSELKIDALGNPISGKTVGGAEYEASPSGQWLSVEDTSALVTPSVTLSFYDAALYAAATEDLENTWFVITGEGQSFAACQSGAATGFDPVVTTVQPYPGVVQVPSGGFFLTGSGAVTGLADHVESGSGNVGETWFSGLANNLVSLIEDAFGKKPGKVIGFASALGATEQAKLLGGSDQFERSTRAFADICALAQAQGAKVIKIANFVQQGNRDTNQNAAFAEFMQGRRIWRQLREARDRAASGQTRPAIWLDAQTSQGGSDNVFASGFSPSQPSLVQAAQHGMADNVVCPFSHYAFDHGDGSASWDGIHPSSQGYYDIGFNAALVIFEQWFGPGFHPIRLEFGRAHWASTSKVLIPISGPLGFTPVIDTSDSVVTVTTLSSSYRGFQAARRNSAGTGWEANPVTALSIEGYDSEPMLEVTLTDPCRTALSLWAGFRQEGDAGRGGGAVTPIRSTASYTPENGGTALYHWCLAGGAHLPGFAI